MRSKTAIHITLYFFLVCLVGGLFLYVRAPAILESQLRHYLSNTLQSYGIGFHIDRIGLSQVLLSDIRVGEAVEADTVRIGYAFGGETKIRPVRINISGLTLSLAADKEGSYRLPGDWSTQSSGEGERPLPVHLLPEIIEIKNSRVELKKGGQVQVIPFDLKASLKGKADQIQALVSLDSMGSHLSAGIVSDIKKKTAQAELTLPWFETQKIRSFFPEWSRALTDEMGILDLSASAGISNKMLDFQARFKLKKNRVAVIPLVLKGQLDLTRGHFFEVQINSDKIDGLAVQKDSVALELESPAIDASFSGTPQKVGGRIHLLSGPGSIARDNHRAGFKSAAFESTLALDVSGEGIRSALDFRTGIESIRINARGGEADLPGAGLTGRLVIDKGGQPSVDLVLTASNATFKSSEFKLKTDKVDLVLPFQYPFKDGKKGRFKVESLFYDRRWGLNSEGTLLQTGLFRFDVDGSAGVSPFTQIRTHFKADLGWDKAIEAKASFKTDPFTIRESDIARLVSGKMKQALMELHMSAQGTASYSGHRLETGLSLDVSDGTFQIPDAKLTASGIRTQLVLNDLLVPESVPGQHLLIDRVDLDKIKLDDLRIRYSIEDAKSILLENIRFKWCKGLVSSEAIRIPHEDDLYSLTLYCDRLELSDLLKQIGAFNADGNGTLNGRIPVIYSKGNISFENGFLFSTPGSGGRIRIRNSERIIAGIPMDAPQFSQLDLAREALKDFEYQWAKLAFNTTGDTLAVNMQLDGEPGTILPFEYHKDLGRFVRVDAKSPGSHFQGIKLDVNLKLPFNEVMKFGNKLKSILNQ